MFNWLRNDDFFGYLLHYLLLLTLLRHRYALASFQITVKNNTYDSTYIHGEVHLLYLSHSATGNWSAFVKRYSNNKKRRIETQKYTHLACLSDCPCVQCEDHNKTKQNALFCMQMKQALKDEPMFTQTKANIKSKMYI